MRKKSTKNCIKCGSDRLALFTSTNKKLCTVCYTEMPWYLDEGQKPLHTCSADTIKPESKND